MAGWETTVIPAPPQSDQELVEGARSLSQANRAQSETIEKQVQPSFLAPPPTIIPPIPFGGPSFLGQSSAPMQEQGVQDNFGPTVSKVMKQFTVDNPLSPLAGMKDIADIVHSTYGDIQTFMQTQDPEERIKASTRIAGAFAGGGAGFAEEGAIGAAGGRPPLSVIPGGKGLAEQASNKLMNRLTEMLKKGEPLTDAEKTELQGHVNEVARSTQAKPAFNMAAEEDKFFGLSGKGSNEAREAQAKLLNAHQGYLLPEGKNTALASARLTGDLETEYELLGEHYKTAKGATREALDNRMAEVHEEIKREAFQTPIPTKDEISDKILKKFQDQLTVPELKFIEGGKVTSDRIVDWLKKAGVEDITVQAKGKDKTEYIKFPDPTFEGRKATVRLPADQHRGFIKPGTLDAARKNASEETLLNWQNLVEAMKWRFKVSPDGNFLISPGKEPKALASKANISDVITQKNPDQLELPLVQKTPSQEPQARAANKESMKRLFETRIKQHEDLLENDLKPEIVDYHKKEIAKYKQQLKDLK